MKFHTIDVGPHELLATLVPNGTLRKLTLAINEECGLEFGLVGLERGGVELMLSNFQSTINWSGITTLCLTCLYLLLL